MRRFLPATALAAIGLFATAAMAQKSSANRTTMDSTFAAKAAQGGLAEVELGNLAHQKASSQAVKDFAKRMVDDHTQANNDLKQVAQKNNLTLPDALSPKDRALKNRLEKLSGSQFDRVYMAHMVSDHKTDVGEFKREADSGQNPDLKAFAAKTLPTLEEHLKLAESTDSKVKK